MANVVILLFLIAVVAIISLRLVLAASLFEIAQMRASAAATLMIYLVLLAAKGIGHGPARIAGDAFNVNVRRLTGYANL